MIRDIVCQYLQRLGYNVLEAEDGTSAVDIIERLEQGCLDLVVTDLLMPGVGGEAVLRSAQERGGCGRFLIISGFTHQMEVLDPRIRDHSGYLEKPFTFSAFKSEIAKLREKAR